MKQLRTLLTTLVLSAATTLALHAEPLAIGAAAPDATAANQDGQQVKLQEVYAKGPTLVYFYPKSDTPGCTKQACSLRDDWSELQAKGIQVVGVSGDKVESQKAFIDKHKLPFTILADTEGQVANAFGVPLKGNIPKRMSFLVQDGKIVWNMTQASTATHAKDVLAAYDKVKKS